MSALPLLTLASHLACTVTPPQSALSSAASAWSFTYGLHAQTQATDAQGQALPGLDGLSGGFALRGQLLRFPAGLERDGSSRWGLRFIEVERAATDQGPWSPSELSGRLVVLRSFEQGGLLTLENGEVLADAPRWGDLAELLLVATRPVTPAMRPGALQDTRQSWPFAFGSGRSWQLLMAARWIRPGPGPTLQYTATLEGKGSDQDAGAQWRIEGTLEGAVEPAIDLGDVRSHSLSGQRSVWADYPLTGARVVQSQTFSLSLSPVPAPPGPLELPSPLRLEPDALLPALNTVDWGACAGGEPWRLDLIFTATPEGRAEGVQLSGEAPEADQRCLLQAAQGLLLPSHAGDPVQVRWPLLAPDGVYTAYPLVFLQRREPEHLLVWWPEDPELRALLRRYLRPAASPH